MKPLDWHWVQMKFLHGYLYQSQSPSVLDNDETADVIRLTLESAALLGIVGMQDGYGYRDDTVNWGTAILVAIISHLGRRLQDPAEIHNGEQLFTSLEHTEVKRWDGETRVWDLGEWLRTQAPEILTRCPSSAAAIRDVYDALSALYPLCEHNPKLRAIWDRIGCSGAPDYIIYVRRRISPDWESFLMRPTQFLDPYLDLGDFFASAEDALLRSQV